MSNYTWNEADHPRDDDGKFTYKNGTSSHNSIKDRIEKENKEREEFERRAEILYKNMKVKNKNETFEDFTPLKNHLSTKLGGDITKEIKQNLQKSTGLKVQNDKNNGFKFTKPVEGKITSDFGYRVAPTKGASAEHSGVDIAIPAGTPIMSVADGKVVAARNDMRGYGTGVFIDHGIIEGKHVISEYGHLREI